MANILRHILLLLLAFILQTTWVPFFEVFGIQPDLILLALVLIALDAGRSEAILLGFCIGFVQDTYWPVTLGLNALAKSIVAFAAGCARSGIMADKVQVQIAFVAGAVLLHDLIYYLGDSSIRLADAPFFWLRYGLGQALYTGALGVLLACGRHLHRRFFPA